MTHSTCSEDAGFEEHVLLNHLLKGFPTRGRHMILYYREMSIYPFLAYTPTLGPVRHFMEMVVTGLSKNPHYTAQEKREYVEWYRNYFSQFSDEELQTLPSTVRKDKH